MENQVGVIHPELDVEAAVRYAYNDARVLCQSCYLTAPQLEIKSHNVTSPENKWADWKLKSVVDSNGMFSRVTVVHIPSHIYHMTFEVMKNAMQATIENNWDNLQKLPPIKVKF